jgi:hypothetical protein
LSAFQIPGWVKEIRPAMMTLNKVLLYTLANFDRGKGSCWVWSIGSSDPFSATDASVLSATKTCEDTLARRTDMVIKSLKVLKNGHVCFHAEHLHFELERITARKI